MSGSPGERRLGKDKMHEGGFISVTEPNDSRKRAIESFACVKWHCVPEVSNSVIPDRVARPPRHANSVFLAIVVA